MFKIKLVSVVEIYNKSGLSFQSSFKSAYHLIKTLSITFDHDHLFQITNVRQIIGDLFTFLYIIYIFER